MSAEHKEGQGWSQNPIKSLLACLLLAGKCGYLSGGINCSDGPLRFLVRTRRIWRSLSPLSLGSSSIFVAALEQIAGNAVAESGQSNDSRHTPPIRQAA